MRIITSLVAVAALSLTATAENAVTPTGDARTTTAAEEPALETIIKKHVAALGGEKLMRGGKSFTFTVTGEKMGKKFTKTVTQVRPNMMRVDVTSDDGPFSKGYDGKVAWMKKGTAKAEAMSAEDTASMAMHAQFEEPLVDYAKKGTSVKLIGKADVKGTATYDLEVTLKNGDVEHHFLDAKTFLLTQRTMKGKDKDGKEYTSVVRFGDYKKFQGRMVNQSVEWDYEGKTSKSTISKIAYDVKVDNKIFAMPKD